MSDLHLAEQAGRRARLAALLGRLLVAEPGPDVADLVAGVPALAPLGTADAGLAAEYERLLLREVPPYESLFLGDDGQVGGPVVADVVASYERHGFDEAARWRVAWPDHLGLELRCYAHLCAEEQAGWQAGQPDRAARAVDAERRFLAEHLGHWGPVAATAVARRAGDSPYGRLAAALGEFLDAEAELLRPDPDHPDLPPMVEPVPPERLGPARLARFLLAPARCGAYLDADDLAEAALALGIPWRPSDPRSRLREVLEDAADAGDLADLLGRLRPAVAWWAREHGRRESTSGGARRTWRGWRLRAEATLGLLDRLAEPRPVEEGPAVVEVRGPDRHAVGATATAVLAGLRADGLRASVTTALNPRLAAFVGALVDAGADEVLLTGRGLALLAFADRGPVVEARLLERPHVLVRLADAADEAVALVAPGGDPALAARCRAVLARLPGGVDVPPAGDDRSEP